MDRILFSGVSSCSSSCAYCFAKWGSLYPQPPHFNLEYIDKTKAIIYPCCDSEFLLQNNIYQKLSVISNKFEKLYISLSTKNILDHNQLSQLSALDKHLKEMDKGFIKVSVSFSTKYMIEQLEPNTLSYTDRLLLLHDLSRVGLNCVVIIKPMLPFIPISEYSEIVDDTSFIGKFLLGDLYVDPCSDFYNNYIKGKFGIFERDIRWLPPGTCWHVVDQETRKLELEYFISSKGLSFYNSDIDAITSFLSAFES